MKKIIPGFIFFFACIISIQAQTLYGLTGKGGNDGVGTLIKFIPATNNLTVAKSFENYAANPVFTNFIQASDGKLYGMTSYGGYEYGTSGYSSGTIFSFDPSTATYTKLKNFDGADGNHPSGSLIQASNGKLYGMTSAGGSIDRGVIFSFDPVSSAYTKLIDFDSTNGANPYGSLIQASDGKLYGMTSAGGSINRGVIFSYDLLSSTYTKLKDLIGTTGANPNGSLMQASNGKLYGMTALGGSNNSGVIFSFDPTTSVYTILKDFGNPNPFSDGFGPLGSLIQASNGKLYGMTPYGGNNGGNGVIFSFDPVTSTYTKLMNFNIAGNPNGPQGSLMQASDGKLYGMTSGGGSYNYGAIFSFDPITSIYTMLKDFYNADGSDGAYPRGSLMQASNGKLYGMTSYGGAGNGVIFSFDPSSSTYTKLKNFDAPDGRTPIGRLVYASNGKLYGMTYDGGGGSSDLGVIFSYDLSSSAYTKLMDFDADGGIHYGSLMQASNGKLYGMRSGIGGNNASGVIFSFDPTYSTYTKLKRFDYINGSYPDGTDPEGSLIQASDGKLYGMTSQGGSGNYGVIFSFDPLSSTFTKLKDFYYANGSYPDGSNPGGDLVQASNGKLYGMTAHGGSGYDPGNYYGSGVIFSFDPSSSIYTKLMDFDSTNGAEPRGSLIQASNGKLYGMTSLGGSNNSGVVFSYDPSSSTYTKLKDFGGANGAEPWGSLMQAGDGKLYGMTNRGGINNSGVVFSLDPSTSIFTKLKDLDSTNGAYPLFGNAFTEVSNIASVSIGITAGVNPTCNGQSVTFTATPVNGGSSPSYQWKVDGNNVGTNSPSYTTNTLTNGQVVSCVMTSSASSTTVTSNSITMNVNNAVTPSASIAITSGANPSCAGQQITFTANPTNGGSNPTYQWKVNGNNVGSNSATYTSSTLTNGQVVSCVMTSNLACANPATATSNQITITINANIIPAASIAITSGANPSCVGQQITFTANPTNGGSNPNYQWKVNGNNAGTNSPTFTSNSLTNGQVVNCVMTSTLACANPVTASSNNISITIDPAVVPAIAISQTSCNGNTIGFTANITNGGTNPSYQWSFTGTGTATNFTGSNFTLNNAANGVQVQCRLTSNATCANPVQITSTPLTVQCIGSGTVSPANLDLQVHPNPANQNATITFYLGASIRISLDVFNIVGQQIAILEDRVLNSGNQTIPLNTEKLAPGVYFVRLRTVNYKIAKKFVVIH